MDKPEKLIVGVVAVALFLTVGLILLVRGFNYTEVYRYDINLETELIPPTLKTEVLKYARELEDYFGEEYTSINNGMLTIRLPRERIRESPYADFFLKAERGEAMMYHLVQYGFLGIAGIMILYMLYVLRFEKPTKYDYWGFPVEKEEVL